MNHSLAIIVLVTAVSTALGCAAPAAETRPPVDASAVYACRDFTTLVKDTTDGLVEDAEIRPRIQAIYANATLADAAVAPDMADAGRALLAAATQREAFTPALTRFSAACKTAVWDKRE